MIKSNDTPIADILRNIDNGTIQLPDFQRGWVWEDNRIRALIASISNAYPIGAAMFLDATGNNVHFKNRLFEGVDASYSDVVPKTLVLDGQQRITSIYRSMFSKSVVKTVDFGFVIGGGVTVIPNLDINLRAVIGFADMVDDFGDVGTKNLRFQAGVTYWFM